MKKFLGLLVIFAVVLLVGCKKEEAKVNTYTRDTTSGTRDGFFTTIGFADAVKDNSKLADRVVEVTSNGEMISSLKNDRYGIGYISLSSLEASKLKGLKYEGIDPTEENVLNNSYKLTRNFNYVIRDEFDSLEEGQIVKAFIAYLTTKEAKATISGKDGIIAINNSDPSWETVKLSHPIVEEDNSVITIKFGGSTSVTKIAEALSAEFSKKCGNFKFEHNHTGSGDAFTRTQGNEKDKSNKLHIGFASREFKLTSSEPLVTSTYGKICTDAIVVVVNQDNKITGITASQLKSIYDGTVIKWNNVE